MTVMITELFKDDDEKKAEKSGADTVRVSKSELNKLKKAASKDSRGITDKVGAILKDFEKRGKGEKSALSMLVGPPENEGRTEDFVLGNDGRGDVYNGVSDFITGKSHETRNSKPFSFDEIVGSEKDESDSEWYKKGLV